MGKNLTEIKKNMDECFDRVRVVEEAKATVIVKVDGIYKIFNDLVETFKANNETQMQKHDKYDEHIQELNLTMTNMNNGINELKRGQERLSENTKQLDDDFKTFKEDTNTKFSKIWSYIYRALGAFTAVVLLAGGIYTVFSYYADKNATLEARLRTYEKNQFINYGREQGRNNARNPDGSQVKHK